MSIPIRRPLALLSCALVAAACAGGGTRASDGTPTQYVSAVPTARIDSIFAPLAPPGSPGCAVGAYRAGEVLFAKGYGMASIEHSAPITPRTPFAVASLSKQFTAFAVHLLERRGQLSLDDDIRRHLPELPEANRVVTVRHLLHHTSGLRAYEVLLMLTGWNRDHPLSREQALAVIGRQRTLGFGPGERHQYGNTNYILLAEIVERVSGHPLDRFLSEEVFAPLGMTHTQLRTDPLAVIPGRADTYWPRQGGGFRRNHIWAFAHSTGAINLVTTVEDLARWDAEFYHERVGGAGIAAAMYRRARLLSGDSIDYASGIENGVYRGVHTVGHTGGGGGDYVLLRFPTHRLTTAVLCNYVDGDAATKAYRVAEMFLGDALAPLPSGVPAAGVALPESALAHFSGEYRDAKDPQQRLRISVREGTLGYEYAGTFYPAEALGPRTFRNGSFTFGFTEPVAGTSASLWFERPGLRGTLIRWIEPPWRPTPDELELFAGTYRSDELDVDWTLALRDDSLVVRRAGVPDRVLTPTDHNSFQLDQPYEDMTLVIQLAFERAPGGRATGFRLTTSRVWELEFNRTADRSHPNENGTNQ